MEHGDLIAFMKARLDEDEALARAVEDRSAPWDGQWVAEEGGNAIRTVNGHVLAYGQTYPPRRGLAAHIAHHDPARVLREVERGRRLLKRYENAVTACTHVSSARARFTRGQDEGYREAYLDAIRDAAEAHAGHSAYREEWRPEG